MKTTLRNEINRLVPYRECGYRNLVIADTIAEGKGDKLTDNWLMHALLRDVEDEFITYEQSLALEPIYRDAIARLRAIAE